jgi:tetratricopeptide (TPR) repeat protein
MRSKQSIVALLILLVSGSLQAAGLFCGDLKASYGPFDYRKRDELRTNFDLVEGAHFTSDVENGIKGSTGLVGGDLNYTLMVVPNHQRALATLVRLALRDKAVQVAGMKYPVECYFDRATRFAPDDGAVRATYGNYLFSVGKAEKALEMFKESVALEPDNATFNYNLGLAYLKAKDYEQANTYAHKAYALGFPLPGLKKQLVAAGKWDDKPE